LIWYTNGIGTKRRTQEGETNAALRRRFEHEHGLPPRELERRYNIPELQDKLHLSYREWLRSHGIYSESGAVGEEGQAFLDESVDGFIRGSWGAESYSGQDV